MFDSDIALVFAAISLNIPNGNFHMAKNVDVEQYLLITILKLWLQALFSSSTVQILVKWSMVSCTIFPKTSH